MTIDELIERARTAHAEPAPTFLVYTTGSKEFFHGQVLDASSADTLLLRQADGSEVLIVRRHIVAIVVAAA